MALSIDEKIRLIKDNHSKLEDAIKENYGYVIKSNGRIQVQIYLWSDGKIEELTVASGSNEWLQPKDWEERELIHVCTVKVDPGFYLWDYAHYLWDYAQEPKPDDETEAEKMEQEIVEYLLDEYDPSDRICQCIDELENSKLTEEYDI